METVIKRTSLPYLRERVEKLNKTANKLGLQDITLQTINIDNNKVQVIINGNSPKLNGWEIAARLEHIESGVNVIHHNPLNDIEITNNYRSRQWCDHCHSNRQRNNTYVIYNENTKEYKQVGSKCLHDFTGHTSIENILEYIKLLDALEGELVNNNVDKNSGKDYYLTVEVLTAAHTIIKESGYYKRVVSVNDTLEYIDNIGGYDLELCNNIIDWINIQDSNNNYWYNVQTYISSDDKILHNTELNYVVSAVGQYVKALNKPKIGKNKVSEYIGNVGDKLEITVTCDKTIEFDGIYGRTALHIFNDDNGNDIIWYCNNKTKVIEEGKTVTIKCKIAEHKEYKGNKQTRINYVKISA